MRIKKFNEIRLGEVLDFDPKIGDFAKIYDPDESKNVWYIIFSVQKLTPDFFMNSNNAIIVGWVDFDYVKKYGDRIGVSFSVRTADSLAYSPDFSTEIKSIEEIYKKYPNEIFVILDNIYKNNENSKYHIDNVVNVWLDKVPEIAIKMETDKFNL